GRHSFVGRPRGRPQLKRRSVRPRPERRNMRNRCHHRLVLPAMCHGAVQVAFACLPLLTFAQHPADRMEPHPYGETYSDWQPSAWSFLEYRTRCEGESVRGSNTGPIRWMIEFRNRATVLVNFDYGILSPGESGRLAASGRGRIKPRKTF